LDVKSGIERGISGIEREAVCNGFAHCAMIVQAAWIIKIGLRTRKSWLNTQSGANLGRTDSPSQPIAFRIIKSLPALPLSLFNGPRQYLFRKVYLEK
jgi:hypothetical protein